MPKNSGTPSNWLGSSSRLMILCGRRPSGPIAGTSLLGSLEGAYNGTELEDEYGVISGLVAPGAGVYPTTDAVVKDLADIVEGRQMPMPTSKNTVVLGSTANAERRYYLRFSVANQAGSWRKSVMSSGNTTSALPVLSRRNRFPRDLSRL